MALQKCVLRKDVRERLLSSQELLGKLADRCFNKHGEPLQTQAIYKRITDNRAILFHVDQMSIIREVLGLPEEEVIHEYVSC